MYTQKRSLYLADVITGIFATLAQREIYTLICENNTLDLIFGSLMGDIQEQSASYRFNVHFHVRPHPIHGDSPILRNELGAAMQRGIVTREHPQAERLHIQITQREASEFIRSLPGSEKMYNNLTDRFLQYYSSARF